MLTELPGMLRVFERLFQLEYSESYTCNIHGQVMPELRSITTVYATGYSIWNTLGNELQLIFFNSGNFWCWYLQHWGWAIYKVSDSRARDVYGNCSHSEGTYVLLEIPSMYTLVQYFQSVQEWGYIWAWKCTYCQLWSWSFFKQYWIL